MSAGPDDITAPRDRNEAPGERLDRQWNELLQELRVTQTGIQLLGGFLLILPFQSRFSDLSPVLKDVYLTAVVTAALATFFVIAPVVAHRSLFRQHRKDVIVTLGHWSARIGLGLLGITVTLGVSLIFGVVISHTAALAAGIAGAVLCGFLWWALPAIIAVRHPVEDSYHSN